THSRTKPILQSPSDGRIRVSSMTDGPLDPTTFVPAGLAVLDDPYPVYRSLHATGRPAIRTASGITCVIGYAAADRVLRDSSFRSGPIAERFHQLLPSVPTRYE